MFAKCDECEDKLPLTTNLSKHNGEGHEHNLILFTQLLMDMMYKLPLKLSIHNIPS